MVGHVAGGGERLPGTTLAQCHLGILAPMVPPTIQGMNAALVRRPVDGRAEP
ncbi:MAG: hypothetical protein ABSC00_04960 [Acidimicrobiales bacterium]